MLCRICSFEINFISKVPFWLGSFRLQISKQEAIVRKAHREKLRENRMGAGERWGSGVCKHCIRYLIRKYQVLVYTTIGQFEQSTSTLTLSSRSRACRVKQTWQACETLLHRFSPSFFPQFFGVFLLLARLLVCTDREPGTGYIFVES